VLVVLLMAVAVAVARMALVYAFVCMSCVLSTTTMRSGVYVGRVHLKIGSHRLLHQLEQQHSVQGSEVVVVVETVVVFVWDGNRGVIVSILFSW
jgi:hypothetical protein